MAKRRTNRVVQGKEEIEEGEEATENEKGGRGRGERVVIRGLAVKQKGPSDKPISRPMPSELTRLAPTFQRSGNTGDPEG